MDDIIVGDLVRIIVREPNSTMHKVAEQFGYLWVVSDIKHSTATNTASVFPISAISVATGEEVRFNRSELEKANDQA